MDQEFSSGSLTGCVLLASRYWTIRRERTERFAREPSDPPGDWPEACPPSAGEHEPLADTG